MYIRVHVMYTYIHVAEYKRINYKFCSCYFCSLEIDRQGLNCEPMNDKFQVAWSIDGDMINFELAGLIGKRPPPISACTTCHLADV